MAILQEAHRWRVPAPPTHLLEVWVRTVHHPRGRLDVVDLRAFWGGFLGKGGALWRAGTGRSALEAEARGLRFWEVLPTKTLGLFPLSSASYSLCTASCSRKRIRKKAATKDRIAVLAFRMDFGLIASCYGVPAKIWMIMALASVAREIFLVRRMFGRNVPTSGVTTCSSCASIAAKKVVYSARSAQNGGYAPNE